MLFSRLLACLAALAVYGCASVPETITTPVSGPDVRQVRTNPDRHVGERIRWGGTITEVKNLQDRTVVTVVARRTTRRGEPLGDEPSTGRFLLEVNRFLDPEEYKTGRQITVVGTISEIRSGKIDQYAYDYPVVRAEDLYLWAEYVRRRDPYPYPYYGWPYYDPFWGHPWHRNHLYGFGHYPWHY